MNRSTLVVGLTGTSLVLASSLAAIGSLSASAAVPAAATGMTNCYIDMQSAGRGMTSSGGVSTYTVLGGRSWARSESIWGSRAGCVKLTRARTVTYSFDTRPRLGNTAPSVWQVISQLQGPTAKGTWPGPPVALVVERGRWHVEGGYAVPNANGSYRSDLGYNKTLPRLLSPVKVGIWQHWTFVVLLGGPRVGTVNAWLGRTKVVNAFKPAAGTMYAVGGGYSTSYLQIKTGLYTGAGGQADAPGYTRTVQMRNVKYSVR